MTPQRSIILAIDDAFASLPELSEALAAEFDLQTVASAALDLIFTSPSPPDLILVNAVSSSAKGLDICQRLTAEPALAQIPLVLMIGPSDSGAERQGLMLGVADVVTQTMPVDIACQRIRNRLSRERRHRAGEAQRAQLAQQLACHQHELYARQLSELRWRAIVDAAPVPMALNDAQHRITYLNAAFQETFGYTVEDIPTLADWWPKAYPEPAYRQQVYTEWQARSNRSHRSQTPFEPMELQVCCKDGQTRTVLVGSVALGESGQDAHLVTFYDITERKVLEEKVSDLNRNFVSFLENTGDFVYFKDARSRFLFCSQTLADITGHTSWRDMLGKHDLEVFPRDLAQIYGDEEVPILRDGVPLLNKINPFYDCDGQAGWVSTNKWPLLDSDGKVVGLFGISRDITAHRQADLSLLRSETLLRSVIDGIPDPVLLKDARGNFLLGNAAVARLYGTTPEAMVGKHDGDFGVPPDMADAFRANVLAIMGHGRTEIVFEDSRDAQSGDIRHYRSIKKPFKDGLGNNQILVIAQDITEILCNQQKVAESERRLQSVLDATREGIWDWDLPSNQVIHNQRWYETLGLKRGTDDDSVEAFSELIHPEDKARVWQRLDALVQGHSEHYYSEHRLRLKSGSYIWVQDRGRVSERGSEGQPVRVSGSFSDISARKLAEEKLQLAASVFGNTREGITITDTNGTILDVNAAFTHITGFSREEVLGKNPRILSSGRQGKDFYTELWRSLRDKGHWYGEIWNRRKTGEVYAEMLNINAVRDNQGNTRNFVALFSDITLIKTHQQALEHIAHFDALTQLPNRTLLADRLRQGMTQAVRRGQRLAVAFLDLDGFKVVNDTHGHEAGDHLLVSLAARMRHSLRDGDSLARLGGDEFVAVLVDLDDIESSLPTLTRLIEAAAQPLPFGDVMLQVSASVGVTFYPQADAVDADQLLRQADQAMYQAKLAGKNRYQVFDAELDKTVRGQHEILERIRLALLNEEFVLHYQPKVNMRSGDIVGAEALIRWQHPQRGLLHPIDFLPLIEDHALAVEVGEWVIRTALTQMDKWHRVGLDLPVSVNVGARQLQQPDFVPHLRGLLAANPNVRPACLELEVLETSALEDLARVSQVIESVRQLGVKFALDDFGTGYSSLAYLKRLSVTQLKIDQTFVRDMLDDPDDLAILDAVLGLCVSFRLQVIAEGVETIEHGEMLLQLGCELAQGYGIARPMPAEKMLEWAAHWRPDPVWRNLTQVPRKLLPLLFASVEHRAWVLAMGKYLKGQAEAPPPLDHQLCRFGQWLQSAENTGNDAQAAIAMVEALHRHVHALANELCDMRALGFTELALTRLGELHALRDQLLVQLKLMLYEEY